MNQKGLNGDKTLSKIWSNMNVLFESTPNEQMQNTAAPNEIRLNVNGSNERNSNLFRVEWNYV